MPESKSLRDEIAIAAMAAWINKLPITLGNPLHVNVAGLAYETADAMLKERENDK